MTATSGSPRLTPDRHRRLALVRVLLEQGRAAVREAAPFGALGLLPLHDAVEMFLRVAAEAVGAKVGDRTQFHQYFELLNAEGVALAEGAAMDLLNRARVSLKHAGLPPHPADLAGHAAAAERFFAANVPLVFARELAAISLVALVRDADVRTELEAAERHLAAEELSDALKMAAVPLARALVRAGITLPGDVRAPAFAQNAELVRVLGEVHALVTAQSVGIDVAAYAAFRTITPSVFFSANGTVRIQGGGPTHPERSQAEVAVEFATHSVIRVEDALSGVEGTYERFGVVRGVGGRLFTRQHAEAAKAARRVATRPLSANPSPGGEE